MKWKDEQRIGDVVEKNKREITKFLSHYPPHILYLILYKAFHSTKAPPFSEYVLVKNIWGEEEKIRLIAGDFLVFLDWESGEDSIFEI